MPESPNIVSLGFAFRQAAILVSHHLTLHTNNGEVRCEYLPASEWLSIGTGPSGEDVWYYDFYIVPSDLPSGFAKATDITCNHIQDPYLTACGLFFENSDSVVWSGAGTKDNPFKAKVLLSSKNDNAIKQRSDGLYALDCCDDSSESYGYG